MKTKNSKNKKVKFIPCGELDMNTFEQTYRWHKTNKGSQTKRVK